MKKALLLVNPVSGKQAAKQYFFDIVNNLSLFLFLHPFF